MGSQLGPASSKEILLSKIWLVNSRSLNRPRPLRKNSNRKYQEITNGCQYRLPFCPRHLCRNKISKISSKCLLHLRRHQFEHQQFKSVVDKDPGFPSCTNLLPLRLKWKRPKTTSLQMKMSGRTPTTFSTATTLAPEPEQRRKPELGPLIWHLKRHPVANDLLLSGFALKRRASYPGLWTLFQNQPCLHQ